MIRKIFQYLFTPFLKNESEIQSLNGIRAVAILLVIVYHVWLPFEVSSLPNVLKNVISNFNSGVDLFFTLSGFLIYSGILKYRKNPNEFDKRKFILARSLRIFPPYYFCLFVLSLFSRTTKSFRGGDKPKRIPNRGNKKYFRKFKKCLCRHFLRFKLHKI
ncbi:acyltransferase family protein [Leptospira noguchii]|uniref:Acyltransferase domain protein n=1 Tax=Leptospira noguchii str. 2001034031 TaxID=1193053 RepID=M6YDX1_9LEPT|nr:acyltransferase [Leptospira noguchii]EMO90021.1 acyltransferase domain protein [Leptospira noguchii str. 2001034031]